jgi:hypothetical protein
MSKIKSNRAKGQLKNSPSRRKMYLIVGILLSLMLTSGAFAQWAGIISFTQKSKQKNSGELAPASLSSASPSKEYIYAGGRIIATEEPASGANPLYEGYHDTADCTSITGWAWDANQPNTPISVQIYDGTNLLATVPADQYRPDLETAGKGNGVHGFTFTTPSSLKDGLLHTIYVKYAGTTTNLFSTPRPITCSGGGGQTPFPGTHNIPGVLQAEDFDNGGQNIAYYDTNPQTNSWGAYRPNEGVDIAGPLTDGTYEVGDVVAGEWLEYTINVTSGGTFNFHARVASAGQGGNFHLVVDDNAVPGFMTVPDTGGWGTYTTITKTGVTLSPGTRVLRVAFDTNGSSGATGNFNFFEFTTAGGTATGTISASPNPICNSPGPGVTTITWSTTGTTSVEVRINSPNGQVFGNTTSGTWPTGAWVWNGTIFYLQNIEGGQNTTLDTVTVGVTPNSCGGQTPFPGPHDIPGVLQAEDFDNGGQNIAYYDTNPQTNSWGAYRPNEGVDIAGPLTDGTYEVGDVVAGEWLEYTINVTSGGTFNFHARVASAGQGGNFHLVVDDNAVPGFMTVPDTGGWGTYTTITKTGVTLSPGTRVLRVAFDTNGSSGATGNFNFFEFTTAGGTGTGLKGEYFNNTLLAGSPALTRTDATVDFNWEGSPDPSINIDTFTVRWTGQVEAPTGGTYFFTLSNCDDGVKLFVNNQEVINEWRAQCCPTFSSSGITLNGGTKYDIRLEFWEQTGGASVHLLWSGPGIAQQVIPQSRLYPAAGGGCTYSISQPSQAFGASSGTGSVNVNTGASCPWAVTGNPGWITLTSGSNGTGPGPVNYLVAANTGAARSATLTIAGQSYTVTQAAGGGSSCTSVAVSPTTKTVSPAAGILTGPSVFVSPGSCTWTAASNVGWLSVTSGSPGAGNGSFGFSVQQNTTGISRTGIITVTGAAGVTANYTVKQNK